LGVLQHGIKAIPLDKRGGRGAIALLGVRLEIERDVDHGNSGGIAAPASIVVDDA
jgi:hypothetical protein